MGRLNPQEKLEKQVARLNAAQNLLGFTIGGGSSNESKTQGILYSNETYRNNNLEYIWDKYNMLPDSLTYSLSQLNNVVGGGLSSPKDLKSLYGYAKNEEGGYAPTQFNYTNYHKGERKKARQLKKEGYKQSGVKVGNDGVKLKNLEDKNQKKQVRQSFRERRKVAKKAGIWFDYGDTTNDLDKYSVLNPQNGMVDIVPISRRGDGDKIDRKELKRCMFSITNLATRDKNNKVGTVMWFPPYDLNFQESVSVQWDAKQFIGRGEPIYSYVNTVRNGTLSFTLLIDHPSLVNSIRENSGNVENNNKEFVTYRESEYEFFKEIYSSENMLRDNIMNKVKYFHPAYHSLSPEGFNMRLNFLHQCTRQGPTTGAEGVAVNSVFGNPPFCELRIGDFINTRIAINSMSITYDNGGGTIWDMNPEGIGVQPMIAKVSLGIHIIGGQSLEGHVIELCNAVSNNFYANTGVYANDNTSKEKKDKKEDKNKMLGQVYNNAAKEIDNEMNEIKTDIKSITDESGNPKYWNKAENDFIEGLMIKDGKFNIDQIGEKKVKRWAKRYNKKQTEYSNIKGIADAYNSIQ